MVARYRSSRVPSWTIFTMFKRKSYMLLIFHRRLDLRSVNTLAFLCLIHVCQIGDVLTMLALALGSGSSGHRSSSSSILDHFLNVGEEVIHDYYDPIFGVHSSHTLAFLCLIYVCQIGDVLTMLALALGSGSWRYRSSRVPSWTIFSMLERKSIC